MELCPKDGHSGRAKVKFQVLCSNCSLQEETAGIRQETQSAGRYRNLQKAFSRYRINDRAYIVCIMQLQTINSSVLLGAQWDVSA